MFDGFYRGKRVFVTGHTGFKGSWLSAWLLKLGATVAGYSVGVRTKPSHFEVLDLGRRLAHFVGDIRRLDSLTDAFNAFRPDVVFHLAAQAITRLSYEEPKLTLDTNLGGTVNILEAMRTTPSTQVGVLITSDKCYENVEWEYGYRESDRLGGKDPYSASKACAEIAFSAYARSFFKAPGSPAVATARAGNVIGGGDWALDRIVPDCVRAWTDGKPVLLRYPRAVRPWQHVLEPLSGYLWLGARLYEKREGLAGESFNFGPSDETEHSVLDLVSEMQKVWPSGEWCQEVVPDAGKHEASLLKLNCDKAFSRLPWRATFTFAEAARITAEWYKVFYESPAKVAACTAQHIDYFTDLARDRRQSWSASPTTG